MKALAGWIGFLLVLGLATSAMAQAGNGRAFQIADASAEVNAALDRLTRSAQALHDPDLRQAALSALDDTACLHHRAGLGAQDKTRIIDRLVAAGWLSPPRSEADRQNSIDGVFPPVVTDGSLCPLRPQPFLASPGGNGGSHHDWPGGLALHEAFNLRQSLDLSQAWHEESGLALDQDLLTTAVIWHDWAKALVFQWRDDGSERSEIQIAGTGAHHVLALAEAMSRDLPPRLVRTMACAHLAPLDDNRKKIEGWLQAAAIIARKDTEARLYRGASWPPECFVHTLSDQNWLVSEPAAEAADAALAQVAKRFGLMPGSSDYNWHLRLPALTRIGAMRLWQVSQAGGDKAMEREIRDAGLPVKQP